MPKLRLFALLIGLLLTGTATADGKALHDAACLQCHASITGGKPTSLYTRADRKVSSLTTLTQRVKYCEQAADVKWSEAQRQQVVNYLAEQFYHF